MKIIPNLKNQLKQSDDVIRTEFRPAITVGIKCYGIERRLMPLLSRFVGLGIPIFSESPQKEYEFSTMLSKNLAINIIINQQPYLQTTTLQKDQKQNKTIQNANEELQKLRSTLSNKQRRLNEVNRKQAASRWLTTIPLSEEGYDLTK